MVGAGLSLNAEPLPGVHTKFPTWKQLSWEMFLELYPPASNETITARAKREDAFKGMNPLRIASEYDAAFERPKLENLIRAVTPDAHHKPGHLHKMLMELPWVDVFTTNYDSLLERTRVPGRVYQPVTQMSDLPSADSPRIVKLHGCLASKQKCIITEDDYRTYPVEFAPFVNTVQQSLIENTFVLLGFSGDDPNFLAWTGWIHDRLGDHHRPIYLVGPLGLGHAQRSLLQKRNITPIDLTPLFQAEQESDARYARSIQWFLKCLQIAAPDRPSQWLSSSEEVGEDLADLPPILGRPVGIPPKLSRIFDGITEEKASNVLRRWRYERKIYPQWLVATDLKRSILWSRTQDWLEPLYHQVSDWTAADRLLACQEINWRLETAMIPLFTGTIEFFDKALEEYYEGMQNGAPTASTLTLLPEEPATASTVMDAWFAVCFALMREARETCNEEKWNGLRYKVIGSVSKFPKQSDRLYYEEVLWSMWRQERKEAKRHLASWQPTALDPLAMMRKAAILAELDELSEALSLLRGALEEIRSSLNTQVRNIELLSLEGWCMFSLFYVEQAMDPTVGYNLRAEFEKRWDELKAWDCNPWPLKEYFDDALKGAPPKKFQEHTRTHEFDLGKVSTAQHWTSRAIDEAYLPAFECIRLYEQVGLPMRMQTMNLGHEALFNACRWVAPFIGFGTLAVLVRAGRVDDFKKSDLLARWQVSAMEQVQVDRLWSWCVRILERELSELHGPPDHRSAASALLQLLPEILSRLVIRLNAAALDQSFRLAMRLHHHPGIRTNFGLHDTNEDWFHRLSSTAESAQLAEWLPSLLKVPFGYEEVHAHIPEHNQWPDPMTRFPGFRIKSSVGISDETTEQIKLAADWVLRRLPSESGETKRRAEHRIAVLLGWNILSKEQKSEFGRILWSDLAPSGLPNCPGFPVVNFLNFPHPHQATAVELVKNYILDLKLNFAVVRMEEGHNCVTSPWNCEPTIHEAALASRPLVKLWGEVSGEVVWTDSESKILYHRAIDWWNNDKAAFEITKRVALFGPWSERHIQVTLARLPQFLARAVLPYMSWADEAIWVEFWDWMKELRIQKAYPTLALPYTLIHRPSGTDALAELMVSDLSSDDKGRVEASNDGLRHWSHLAFMNRVPAVPNGLLAILIQRVVFREPSGLLDSLHTLACLLVERGEMFNVEDFNLLAQSLFSWKRVLVLHQEVSPAEFENPEKLALRVLVVRLAAALNIWHQKFAAASPAHPAINQWLSEAAANNLFEVRVACDYWSGFSEWQERQSAPAGKGEFGVRNRPKNGRAKRDSKQPK